jgi:hypothetical protein
VYEGTALVVTRQALWLRGYVGSCVASRSTHHSVKELETDVQAWIGAWNHDPKPFAWTKTADEILHNLASYYTQINQLTNDSGRDWTPTGSIDSRSVV